MKNILCLLAILPMLVFSQNRSINFEHSTWNEILSKAKTEKKLIMLDAYTSWCGPCKWMAKNIFTNDTVADFYNGSFVNAKIDMEKDEGPALAKKYGVQAYPTFLFIDGDGNLVHRICGSAPAKNFIETGKDAMTPEKTLAYAEKQFNADPKNSANALKYIEMLANACSNASDAASTYLDNVDEKVLSERSNWKILYLYVKSHKSRAFIYLLKHQDEFGKKYTADSVSGKILAVYNASFRTVASQKDPAAFDALKKEVTQNIAGDPNKIIWQGEMVYYKAMKDFVNYSKSAEKYGDAYAMNDAHMLNQLAWDFYLNVTDPVMLQKAAGWAKKSTELEDQYYNNDTHAALLFKLGKKAEAKAAALRAIELGKKENEDVKDTEKLLEQIEGLK